MSRPGVTDAQRAVKLDFRHGVKIGLRNLLSTQYVGHDVLWRRKPVAGEAERVHLRPRLGLELRGMWIMAGEALAVPIGTVKYGPFLGYMTLRTEFGPGGEKGDGGLVFFRDDLVAVLATHPNCGVDEPAFSLLGMAG